MATSAMPACRETSSKSFWACANASSARLRAVMSLFDGDEVGDRALVIPHGRDCGFLNQWRTVFADVVKLTVPDLAAENGFPQVLMVVGGIRGRPCARRNTRGFLPSTSAAV